MTSETGNVNMKKMRALIKSKLIELDALVDEELPDYVMIMVANKKPHDQMARDLQLFLQDNTESFTTWLTALVYPDGPPEVPELVTSEGNSKDLAATDAGEQSLDLTAESDEFADELRNDTMRSVAQSSGSKLIRQPTTAATRTQELAQSGTSPTTTRPKAETSGKSSVPVQSVLTVPHKSRITLNRDAVRTSGDHQSRPARPRSRSRDRPLDLRSKLTAARHGPTVQTGQNAEEDTDKLQLTARTLKNTAAIKPILQTAAKPPTSDPLVPVSDPSRPGLVTVTLSPEDLKLLMEAKSSRPLDPLAVLPESERKTSSNVEPQLIVTMNGTQRTVADTHSHPHSLPQSSLSDRNRDELDEAVRIIHAHSATDTVHTPALSLAQPPLSRHLEIAPSFAIPPTQPVQNTLSQPLNIPPWNAQPSIPTPFGVPLVSADRLLPAPQTQIHFEAPAQPLSAHPTGFSIPPPLPYSMTITAVSGTHYVTATDRLSTQSFEIPNHTPLAFDGTVDTQMHPSNPLHRRPRALAPGDLRAKLARKRHLAFPSNPTLPQSPDANVFEEQRFTVNLCDDDDDVEHLEYPCATDSIAEARNNSEPTPARGTSAPTSSERCRFWPACKNGTECPFVHPTEPCRNFPACSFGDRCLFVHPTCKFDASCSRPECPFSHSALRHTPAPTTTGVVHPPTSGTDAVACRFFPNCYNPQCTYYHPQSPAPLDGIQQPRRCMYGSFCPNKAFCKYSHEPQSRTQAAPNRTLFKWVGTKTSSPATPTGSAPSDAGKDASSTPTHPFGIATQHPSADAPKRARIAQHKPDSNTPAEHDQVVAQ